MMTTNVWTGVAWFWPCFYSWIFAAAPDLVDSCAFSEFGLVVVPVFLHAEIKATACRHQVQLVI